jgi:PKD repeat protein
MAKIAPLLSLVLMLVMGTVGCATTPAPEADFIASLTTGTVPITIQFTDMSQGDVRTWAWDFNNDQLIDSTIQNPQYTYTSPGVYTIILRAAGPSGTDIETKSGYIQLSSPTDTANGVSPSSGYSGEMLDVVITGTNFTGTTAVNFGNGITVNSFTVAIPTQITANISISPNAPAAPVNVSVSTPDGIVTLTGGFMVIVPDPPTVTSISPESGDQGRTLYVVMTGTNFDRVTALDFGDDITVNNFTIGNQTQITAIITIGDTAAAASRDVKVTNAGGSGTLYGGLTVTIHGPPTVTGLAPASGGRGETLDVALSGSGFYEASAVVFRSGLGVTANGFTVDSQTQITASISISSTATIGSRDISVTTPRGTGTLTGGFEVIGVSPASGSQGNILSVVITSTDLSGATAVDFGDGITVNSFTVDSEAQITVSITISFVAEPGPRDITVTTSSDTEIVVGTFTVAYPTCTANFVADHTTASGATTVHFTDGSIGEITSWAWDMNGDGKIDSNLQNPSYTYTKNGNYTVTLTVSGPYCQDTLTRTGYIKISGCST